MGGLLLLGMLSLIEAVLIEVNSKFITTTKSVE